MLCEKYSKAFDAVVQMNEYGKDASLQRKITSTMFQKRMETALKE